MNFILFLIILITNMWIYLNLVSYKYFEEMVFNNMLLLVSSIVNQTYPDMRFSFLYDMYGNLINVASRNVDTNHTNYVITEFKYYNYEY